MNSFIRPTIVFALLSAVPVLRVLAQQPVAPAPAEGAPAVPATTPSSVPVAEAANGKDRSGRDTLSVDFPDEDVRNILRNVSDLFELNIIMPDTLQGKTTIKLRDVTWRQIFQSVLGPVNYTYLEEGNIIKIVSNESLLQEPTSTDVFRINYAKASDIMATVTSLVDAAAGGRIVVDVRSNSLIITERPSRMNRIRPIIEQLDRATDQVMIETKFVEVSDADVKNIGVNWASLANFQLGAGKLQSELIRGREQAGTDGYDNIRNRTVTGRSGTENTNTVTNKNDVQNGTTNTQTSGSNNSNQVTSTNGVITSASTTGMVGAIGANVTNSALNSAITEGLNKTANVNEVGTNNVFRDLSALISKDATSRALSAVFSATDFNIVLSALQSMQKTKIVSNPTIVTLNNSPAVINVGQERPIPSYTYNAERGVYEVSGFTYKPIGVILKVTPQVNSRGFIRLTVEPEVSQSNRDATFNGAAIPIVESRKANTTVSLRDGFTMGIGGLMQQASTNGQSKVPVLGNIPLLGRLFRSDNKNIETTNLIIFITAKTISAEGATVEQIFDSSRVRGLDMKREDLPGYRDGSDPFLPPSRRRASEQPPE